MDSQFGHVQRYDHPKGLYRLQESKSCRPVRSQLKDVVTVKQLVEDGKQNFLQNRNSEC